jgi:hypothetical protein
MKKILVGTAVAIVVIIGVAVYFLLSNIDILVKSIIETQGSQVTQTKVNVNNVHIELSKGIGTIKGLTVANPKGFKQADAFELNEASVDIDLKSITRQPYVIDTITVRAPKVFVSANKDGQVNLNELKKNLQAQHPGEPSQPSTGTEKKEPHLIIRHLLFTGGTIDAYIAPANNKEYKLELPTLKMENLGGSAGATPSELAREIFNRLIDQALEEVKNKGINAEIDKLKSQAQQKLESEKSQLQEKSGEKLKEETNKLQEKLKDQLK